MSECWEYLHTFLGFPFSAQLISPGENLIYDPLKKLKIFSNSSISPLPSSLLAQLEGQKIQQESGLQGNRLGMFWPMKGAVGKEKLNCSTRRETGHL